MVLYHGSERIIEMPQYGVGKPYNDYGKGFYCTESFDLAAEWAVDRERDGYVNKYEIELSSMKILNLAENNAADNVLKWFAILLDNRIFAINTPIAKEAKRYVLESFLPDYNVYDIICGYRADDSYFSFAQDFLNNTISLQQLARAMRYGNLGEQIVLKSEKAFERISFLGEKEVDRLIYYPKKEERDRNARSKYHNLDKNKFDVSDTFIMDIIKKELILDEILL